MTKPFFNRHSIRLKNFDYSSDGIYFITICTYKHLLLFGNIHNNRMFLNEYGKIANAFWLETENIRTNITLGEFIIMPNHMHMIFGINESIDAMYDKTINESKMNHSIFKPKSVGSIIGGYKSIVTSNMRKKGYREQIWQRNYYEHIIRNNESLNSITQYIIENPSRWKTDSYYNE